jgi:hypothetical protein
MSKLLQRRDKLMEDLKDLHEKVRLKEEELESIVEIIRTKGPLKRPIQIRRKH